MEEERNNNWVRTTLLIGATLGAVSGLGVAYLMVRKAQDRQETLQLTPGEGLRLGLLVMGMMRSIADLGDHSS